MAYGVKVQALVDSSSVSKSKFRKELQALATAATGNNPIKIKNVQIDFDSANKKALLDNIRNQLNKADLKIRIKEINAKPAIEKFRKDLTAMLSGLTITGVKEFLGSGDAGNAGTSGTERVTDALERQARAAELAAIAQRELKVVQASLEKAGRATSSISNIDRSDELFAEYQELGTSIANLSRNNIEARRKEIASIGQKVAALNAEIAAELELQRVARQDERRARTASNRPDTSERDAERAAIDLENHLKRVVALRTSVQKYVDKNPRAYAADVYGFQTMLDMLEDEGSVTKAMLAGLSREFVSLKEQAYLAGNATGSIFDKLQPGLDKLANMFSYGNMFREGREIIRNMVYEVQAIDLAMTELKKVTDLTGDSYSKFFERAVVAAKNLGATVSDTISATADFAKLGFNVNEAFDLAQAALVYQNVGDNVGDITAATESLISTIKAFGIEASDAMHVIDAFNEVGNRFAITSTGIGDALMRSAAALNAAGNTMEESIGLITAMNNVIQNPEAVGTTMKTLTMYLRAAKTEAEDAGISTDGMAESVSTLREKLMQLTQSTGKPLDIMIDDNTFKSTYQIIEELAEIWDKLQDTTQANILNLVAGKRNANAITALITNFDDARAAMEAAMDSSGSAMAENEHYMDSIAGKMSAMKASFQELSSNVTNSGLIKWVIDLLRGLMDVANSLAKVNLLLPAILGTVAAIRALSKTQGTADTMTKIGAIVEESMNAADAVDVLRDRLSALSDSEKRIGTLMVNKKMFGGNFNNELEAAARGAMNLGNSMTIVGGRANGAGVGWRAFLASISKTDLVITGVATAVGLVASAIQLYNQRIQDAIDRADEIAQTYQDAGNSFSSNMSTLNGLRDEFDKLSKGVGVNGENISLTASEYESYLSIIHQIASISPQIVSGYNEEGVAVLRYASALDDAIAKEKELYEARTMEYLGRGKSLFEGRNEEYKALRDTLRLQAREIAESLNSNWNINVAQFGRRNRAIREAYEKIGWDYEYVQGNRIGAEALRRSSLPVGALSDLYEHRDEFIRVLELSGEYSTDEIERIRTEILGLTSDLSKLTVIEKEAASYLGTYIKSNKVEGYDLIPLDAIDEYEDGLLGVVDVTKGYAENINAAIQYTTDFADAVTTKEASALRTMADEVLSGNVKLTEFNKALSDFLSAYDGNDALRNALYQFFAGIVDISGAAASGVDDVTAKIVGLSDVVGKISGSNDVLIAAEADRAAGKGLSYDTFKSIADELEEGERIEDYLEVENGLIILNTEKWKERSAAIMDNDKNAIRANIDSLKQQNASLIAQNAQLDAERREAYLDYETSGGTDEAALSRLAELNSLYMANETAILTNAQAIARYNAELEMYNAAAGMYASDDPMNMDQTISDMNEVSKKAKELLEVSAELNSGEALGRDKIMELVGEHDGLLTSGLLDASTADEQKAAIMSVVDAYEEMYDAAINAKIAVLNTAIDDGVAAGHDVSQMVSLRDTLVEIAGMSLPDLIDLGDTKGAADKYEKLSNSISSVTDAMALLRRAGSEKSLSIEMIADLIDMAKTNEWSIGDMFIVDGGTLQANTSLISAHINGIMAEFDAIPGMDEATKEAFKNMLIATAEQEAANDALKESYDGVMSAIGGYSNASRDMQVTYDEFSKLIDVDARYAQAIEYVNGKLTLNREKYEEITAAVADKMAAEAKANALAIQSSKEYIDLMGRVGDLNDAEQRRLDDLNAQITGFAVLASEIDNATAKYRQFLAAPDEASGEQFTAALEAFETINDTLYDSKSDFYQKVGREQFNEAIELLVVPGVDENSPEWKTAWKAVERYFKGGKQGIDNFYNDLIKHGFIDSATGQLEGTISSISSALGISVDATRALFEEFQTYLAEDIEWKDMDTSGIEAGARSAKELGDNAKDAQSPLQTMQDQITNLNSGAQSFNEALSGVNNIDMTGIIGKIGSIGDALGKLIRDLKEVTSKKYSVNVSVKQSATTSSSGSWLGNLWNSLFGKANAGGTTYSPGGKTLVGELGREIAVDPEKNIWYTVGDRGAEFVNLPRGAIVFNAKQTEMLLSEGRIQNRGVSMASGNAAINLFGNILANKGSDSGVSTNTSSYKTGSSVSSGSSGSSSSSVTKQYEKLNEQFEHLLEHQEHLYKVAERGLDYKGMEDSLSEQVRLYKLMMEEASKAVVALKAKGADDTNETLQEMERAYWSAYDSMHDALDSMNSLYVDALADKIDGLQTGYENLRQAADEFNQYNGISVDTFQELVAHGVQYLSFLDNVNGQYVINREGISRMIAAEKEQLAVQSAMAYLTQVQTALNNKDANALASLVNVTQQIGNSTWDAVYAQAALLKTLGLTDGQYRNVIENIDALHALANSVITDVTVDFSSASNDVNDAFEDQRNALDKILDLTKQLIRYETEQRIKAINEQIDAFRKLVDIKKESLRVTQEENKYERELSSKTSEIANLQTRIDLLALDSSREAAAERAKLIEEIAELQMELADYQSEHAYEAQTDAYDKIADAYDESKQEEIKRLEDSISSEEKLYQAAIDRINNRWSTLYDDLIGWNTQAGSVLNKEITENWEKAAQAVLKYGSYIKAIHATENSQSSSGGSGDVVATGKPTDVSALKPSVATPPSSDSQTTAEPTKAVQVTNGRWNVRTGPDTSYKSIDVVGNGTMLQYRGKTSGDWYAVLYEGKEAWIHKGSGRLIDDIPKYHTGGVVGGRGAINDKEVIALLEKDELVLDQKKKDGLYRLIDFGQAIAERFGLNAGKLDLPSGNVLDAMIERRANKITPVNNQQSITINPQIKVEINHNGSMNDADARRFGARIANTTMDVLKEAFARKGVTPDAIGI